MTNHSPHFPTVAFMILLIVGLFIGVWIGISQKDTPIPTFVAQVMPTPTIFTSPAPTPSPSPGMPASISTEWPSSNGKSILVMKVDPTSLNAARYSFYVKTEADPTEKLVFSKTLISPATLTIPFNSWAPDNKHFFLQESDGTQVFTYALTASGEPFADGTPMRDVNILFAEKDPGFLLKGVTGWAAPTLLLINSKTAEGEDGPSYWFDINSKALTRLSTSFQ